MATGSVIDEVSPEDAYTALETMEDSVLIDVRTAAEWDQVGVPDISATGRKIWFVEWVSGPQRVPNPAFLEEVLGLAGDRLPGRMFFICRSGARSMAAANAVAAVADHMGQPVHCTNVAEGFEGQPTGGGRSGWKARGLPWGAA